MSDRLKYVLGVQIFYVVLCVVWNLVGDYQRQLGLPSIGPTASVMMAMVMACLCIAQFFSAKHQWKMTYLSLSILFAVGAMSAIYGAFTKELSLWPSAFWRWAGVVVNLIGVLSMSLVAVYWARIWSPATSD
ncbi:MAG: hypothetical protein ACRBBW_20055 [Cellvibrionaceae bacterium]